MDNAWRYQQETAANGPRDASMLPVDAPPRVRVANVTVNTSRSGQVQGGGTQPWGGGSDPDLRGGTACGGLVHPRRDASQPGACVHFHVGGGHHGVCPL